MGKQLTASPLIFAILDAGPTPATNLSAISGGESGATSYAGPERLKPLIADEFNVRKA
jgi:hypothetical protein